ncbi:MAG: hypothetical protein L6R39_005723, partial [Caloplaca ligustica]
MSPPRVEIHQELLVHDKQELHDSSSPPSTRNASLLNQSTSSKALGTSPHHQRFKSVNPTSPPSNLIPASSDQQRPTSSPSALPTTARASYFSSQPSSGIEARSPANKRAPAYRSSHGIATADGPPPALITQRSYHGEPWRNSPLSNQTNIPNDPLQQPPATENCATLDRQDSATPKAGRESKSGATNGMAANHGAIANAFSYRNHYNGEEEDDTLRTLGGTRTSSRPPPNKSNGGKLDGIGMNDDSHSSNEDLFLNLARTESEAGSALTSTNGTRRRASQIGLSSSRSVLASRPVGSRPASSGQENGEKRSEDQPSRWSRSGRFDAPINGRQSSPRDRSYAVSAHPLDQGKRRYLHSELSSKPSFTTPRVRDGSYRESSPEHVGSYSRRQSITDSASGRPSRSFKPCGRSYVSGNQYNSSPLNGFSPHADPVRGPQSHRPEGTESTLSTTAPSTVWDELDDLKSRIRKLELTGKLPCSSGAAMSGVVNGRPRTASTTMTTASISPKNRVRAATSPDASTVKDADTSNVHPLLHSALAKAKSWIDPKAYKALESTASDALTLAALTGSSKSTGEEASQNISRQIRRKAD